MVGAVALAAILVLVLVLARCLCSPGAGRGRPRAGLAGGGPEPGAKKGLTAAVTIPLARDQYRAAYWASTTVGGRRVFAIADTGSPYFIVPYSLPCAAGTPCVPTGARTAITYGDGTRDDATFTAGPVALGGSRFPSVVFGGNRGGGTGSQGADDAVLGLAPLKPPAGSRFPVPPGASVPEQLGVAVLEFDFADENNASLLLAPPGRGGGRKAGGVLVARAPLVPRGRLWTVGIDHTTDFYVVELDAAKNANAGLGGLKYLILDTGTTRTLLPQNPRRNVTIHFDTGSLNVRAADLGVLPPMYQSQELSSEVGILGNRSMAGYRMLLDLEAGTFSLFAP